MAYIALKPCSFAGKSYRVGNPIPDGAIIPGAIKRLIQAGVIAESEAGSLLPASASSEEENTLTIPIIAEDRGGYITMTVEELLGAVEIAQMKEDDIIEAISKVKSEKQLILIDALSKSEAVYEAAETAARKLIAEETGEPEEFHLDPEQLSTMNYNDLKKLAKDMGLNATGTKEELIERIAAEGVMVEGDE